MKTEIYYWSPFIGRVATIRSVINSMIGLKKFQNSKFKIKLINCFGEWNSFRTRLNKESIDILNLQKKIKVNIDLHGFIFSRLINFITLLVSYKKLKNLLNKNQPKFLIVHLLTFIPFLLYLTNSFKTKLILRISGKPKLGIFRYLLWKISNKNISFVFCPNLFKYKSPLYAFSGLATVFM